MQTKQRKPVARARVNPASAGALAMPHEHDETPEQRTPAGGTAPAPQPELAQAARDLDRGLVDTDNYTRAREITKPAPGPRGRQR